MPGKPVTDQQVRLYMQDRPRHSRRVVAVQRKACVPFLSEKLGLLRARLLAAA